ncbi:baseplate assembly protein [Roseomonas hellenica]|uniref:Baseplate assembly protein n=1 Tax=Plastoroseomonas hellenica TaxID=2687306 RepID=A0ABS5EWS6_9PROT|nr:phage baseplate assembly protein V [Plastoroseomonas hellenica]MBR0664749.1 baseplate assembly protein [Plastoroseomonas hellenica]
MAKYLGKYRGEVASDLDPLHIGRLLVTVADVSDGMPVWAMPCLPPPTLSNAVWMLPAPGAGVWVEFEQGNAAAPIWTGCWYRTASEAPPLVARSRAEEAQPTDAGRRAEIQLSTESGALISIGETGITLSNGKGAVLEMVGPTVSINGGALAVT